MIKTQPTPATRASSPSYMPLLFMVHITAVCSYFQTDALRQTGVSSGRLPGALGVPAESEWVQLPLVSNTRRRHLRVGLTDDNNKRAVSEVWEQRLGDPCFMAADCAPGLFAADDMSTQCEVTPFSAGESVCCKPFATPCDSDEACCSGLCSIEYTRCVQSTPSQSIASAGTTPATSSQTPDAFLVTSTTAGDSSFQPAPAPAPSDTAPPSAMTPTGTPSESPPMSSKQPPSAMPVTDATIDTSRDRQPVLAPGSVPGSTVAPTERLPSRQEEGAASPHPRSHEQGDNKGRSGAESDSGETSQCTLSYALGTIRTVARSKARVQAVAIDSEGNVFYSLGHQSAVGGVDSIRRAANVSASTSDGGNDADNSDELVFVGTGAILALAVDADDNIIYSMDDGLGLTGRVYIIPMTSGGIPASILGPSSSLSPSATTNSATDVSTSSSSTPSSFKGEKIGHAGDSSGTVIAGERKGEGRGGQEASGSSLADVGASLPLGKGELDLGPFLPGMAVCPATGDVYVARGHAGLTRMVKSDNFDSQVHWGTADMVFMDGDKERAPLMIWDVAVDGTGVVYLTTYVQGVVLKGVFPEDGGTPTVRLAAGTWDSGVSASSGDGKRATAARLAFPKGISVGDGNTVYVSEFQGAKVRAVTSRGGISTSAGTGKKDYTGDGGRAEDATLDMPNAIAFALGGEGGPMAIADFGNNAVRVITPSCL